jgi:adenosylcobinamide amidohydrolase
VIEGIEVRIDRDAVVVRSALPLTTVSSAVAGGGFGVARAVVNLHVDRGFACADAAAVVDGFARRRALPRPWVGLLTAVPTELAESSAEAGDGFAVEVVATVGLGNPVTAGVSSAATWSPSTINAIVVVDGSPAPAALVNLVATLAEVKAFVLAGAGVRSAEGALATGTSTDAVVVAATGRGPALRFGGPASALGAAVARAARSVLEAGVRRWQAEYA